ncbi:uncharacterized protein BDR25DRAFT_350635 [Lindgomyces ingoldianus]|uniref:Uncharacterized protein n=1 Tax=Lindgomyces ingoldianus TaxID=673940 RepID=A0ACB6R8Z5_9PLEO|nr:uncharacterized protein BDR25DRAFT_350635 [Lindgomyces ingoldianus]KAF2475238.1 hypothetical protein BDR25DRAFT_350635 [Lindgomyces ingoldianus]
MNSPQRIEKPSAQFFIYFTFMILFSGQTYPFPGFSGADRGSNSLTRRLYRAGALTLKVLPPGAAQASRGEFMVSKLEQGQNSPAKCIETRAFDYSKLSWLTICRALPTEGKQELYISAITDNLHISCVKETNPLGARLHGRKGHLEHVFPLLLESALMFQHHIVCWVWTYRFVVGHGLTVLCGKQAGEMIVSFVNRKTNSHPHYQCQIQVQGSVKSHPRFGVQSPILHLDNHLDQWGEGVASRLDLGGCIGFGVGIGAGIETGQIAERAVRRTRGKRAMRASANVCVK